MAGVTVPLHSAEHFYVVTEPIDGVHPDLPILRDPDGYTYFKEEVGGLVVGGFEPEAKPWVAPDADPVPVRVPAAGRGLGALLGPDGQRAAADPGAGGDRASGSSTTARRASRPTTSSSSARRPSSRNFFVGAGFNSVGIASAGGAGRALAEWIVDGEPTIGPHRRRHPPVRAVQRQQPLAARPGRRGARAALRDPVAQPGDDARPGRSAAHPLHHLLVAAERRTSAARWAGSGPNFFAPTGRRPGHRVLLGQAELAAVVGRRARATPAPRSRCSTRRRSRSTSSSGPTPSARCSGCAPPTSPSTPGRAVYTGMLNARGTYESDVTVTRISATTSTSSSAVPRPPSGTRTTSGGTCRRTSRPPSST